MPRDAGGVPGGTASRSLIFLWGTRASKVLGTVVCIATLS